MSRQSQNAHILLSCCAHSTSSPVHDRCSCPLLETIRVRTTTASGPLILRDAFEFVATYATSGARGPSLTGLRSLRRFRRGRGNALLMTQALPSLLSSRRRRWVWDSRTKSGRRRPLDPSWGPPSLPRAPFHARFVTVCVFVASLVDSGEELGALAWPLLGCVDPGNLTVLASLNVACTLRPRPARSCLAGGWDSCPRASHWCCSRSALRRLGPSSVAHVHIEFVYTSRGD